MRHATSQHERTHARTMCAGHVEETPTHFASLAYVGMAYIIMAGHFEETPIYIASLGGLEHHGKVHILVFRPAYD